MTTLALHIERLIVEGLPLAAGDSQSLQMAVEAELKRLFAGGRLAPPLRAIAVPLVSAPCIEVHRRLGPAGIGRRIARAVFRGIGS